MNGRQRVAGVVVAVIALAVAWWLLVLPPPANDSGPSAAVTRPAATAPGSTAAPPSAPTVAPIREQVRDRTPLAAPQRDARGPAPLGEEADAVVLDTGAAPRTVWPLDRDGIQGAIDEALPEIRRCYEGWLAETPDLAGRIVVGFTVADDEGLGTVSEVAVVEGGTGHEVFEACVLQVIDETQFDAPEDGELVVNYPFVFSTEP